MAFISIDTNILAYAEGLERNSADAMKLPIARALVADVLAGGAFRMASQVAAELHHLLMRKQGLSARSAADRVQRYLVTGDPLPTDRAALDAAFELSEVHGLQTYDAIILAASALAGCEELYSEDMQAGFAWRGLRIVNPFV